ncbi:MAG: methyltransferase, partial [Nitriliruptorales bacterium]
MQDTLNSRSSCPVCGLPPSAELASLERVPATCNALWATEPEARRAPLGDIELLACGRCGFVWNGVFQPELVDYSQRYENCLAFSPAFSAYSDELARWLVERHDLHGKRIVEVGAGSGEFLALLCALGGNRGIGFD